MGSSKKIEPIQVLVEIAVITIGILIAYQLNTWKEDRIRRESEEKILREIRSSLRLDLEDLENNFNGHQKALACIDSLKKWSENGEPYRDEIAAFLATAFRDYLFLPQTSAFETLKSKGVELVQNDSLRVKIQRLYDFDYSLLIQIEADYEAFQFHRHLLHVSQTYYRSFDLTPGGRAVPIVRTTSWLRNPDIRVRLDMVHTERQFGFALYEDVIQKVNQMITAIDHDLNE